MYIYHSIIYKFSYAFTRAADGTSFVKGRPGVKNIGCDCHLTLSTTKKLKCLPIIICYYYGGYYY